MLDVDGTAQTGTPRFPIGSLSSASIWTLVSDRPLFLLVGIIAPLIIATVGANLL
jgi:hypothetical protein